MINYDLDGSEIKNLSEIENHLRQAQELFTGFDEKLQKEILSHADFRVFSLSYHLELGLKEIEQINAEIAERKAESFE